jgi:hypothetical protein
MKTKKEVFSSFQRMGLALSVGTLILFIVLYFIHLQYNVYLRGDHRWLHAMDQDRVNKLLDIITDIYFSSGHLIQTLDELEATAYYPFEQSLAISLCPHATICLRASQESQLWTDEITLTIFYQEKGQNRIMRSIRINTLSGKPLTKLRMQAYLQGVSIRTKNIWEIRNRLTQHVEKSIATSKVYHKHPFPLTARVFPSPPFSHDYPRTQKELDRYLQWLKRVEGLQTLEDGWGQPLRFAMEGSEFIGRSRGADKIWHTRDDLVVRVKVSPAGK